MFTKLLQIILITVISVAASTAISAPVYTVDPAIAGNVSAIISVDIQDLVAAWKEDLSKINKKLSFTFKTADTAALPAELIAGNTSLIIIDRLMTAEEKLGFKTKYDYYPTALPVAIEVIGVFVNQANAIPKLTMEEVDAIFSSTRKCGGEQDISSWYELGGHTDKIVIVANNQARIKNFFQKNVLCAGELKHNIFMAETSAAVLEKIANSRNAIGYAPFGSVATGVKVATISKPESKRLLAPSLEIILQEEYPYSRYLYIYVNKAVDQDLASNNKELLRFLLSAQGQAVNKQLQFYPIPESVLRANLKKINAWPAQ